MFDQIDRALRRNWLVLCESKVSRGTNGSFPGELLAYHVGV